MNTVVRYRNGRSLYDQMDNIFASMMGSVSDTGLRRPAVDVREAEDKYIMEVELPGIAESDVDVTLDDGRLKIETILNKESEEQEEKYLLKERRNAAYSRSFGLPRDVDREKIVANFSNGLLTLELYKAEEAKPRNIKIN